MQEIRHLEPRRDPRVGHAGIQLAQRPHLLIERVGQLRVAQRHNIRRLRMEKPGTCRHFRPSRLRLTVLVGGLQLFQAAGRGLMQRGRAGGPAAGLRGWRVPFQAEREPVVLIRHRHFLTGRQSLGQCDLQIVFLVAKGGFSVFRLHFNQGIVDIFPCAVFLIVDRFLINGRFPIAVRSEKIFHVFFPDFLVLLQQDSGRGCRPPLRLLRRKILRRLGQ